MKPRIAMVAVAAGLMTAQPFHAALADDSADTGGHVSLGFGLPGPAAVEGYVGLAAFDGGSGFKDVGLQIEASYAVSDNWALNGQAGYQRLLTDAADSPLVDQEGSADQFLALIGVTYRF